MTGVEANVREIDPVIAYVGGPRRTVTVESASLIALPGYRLPHLINVGAVPGCLFTKGISASADSHNNVSVTVSGHNVRLIPIHGYQLRTGNSRCVPTLVYELQEDEPGQFADAGLNLDVRSGGRTESVTVHEGEFVWYRTSDSAPTNSQFNARCDAVAAAQSAYWRAHGTTGS
jgi:hypothetical protein